MTPERGNATVNVIKKPDLAGEIRQAIHDELAPMRGSGWAKDFNGNAVIDAAVRVAVAREEKLRDRLALGADCR